MRANVIAISFFLYSSAFVYAMLQWPASSELVVRDDGGGGGGGGGGNSGGGGGGSSGGGDSGGGNSGGGGSSGGGGGWGGGGGSSGGGNSGGGNSGGGNSGGGNSGGGNSGGGNSGGGNSGGGNSGGGNSGGGNSGGGSSGWGGGGGSSGGSGGGDTSGGGGGGWGSGGSGNQAPPAVPSPAANPSPPAVPSPAADPSPPAVPSPALPPSSTLTPPPSTISPLMLLQSDGGGDVPVKAASLDFGNSSPSANSAQADRESIQQASAHSEQSLRESIQQASAHSAQSVRESLQHAPMATTNPGWLSETTKQSGATSSSNSNGQNTSPSAATPTNDSSFRSMFSQMLASTTTGTDDFNNLLNSFKGQMSSHSATNTFSTSSVTSSMTSSASATGSVIPIYGACGGSYQGTCAPGSSCICKDQYYSQCRPNNGGQWAGDSSWQCQNPAQQPSGASGKFTPSRFQSSTTDQSGSYTTSKSSTTQTGSSSSSMTTTGSTSSTRSSSTSASASSTAILNNKYVGRNATQGNCTGTPPTDGWHGTGATSHYGWMGSACQCGDQGKTLASAPWQADSSKMGLGKGFYSGAVNQQLFQGTVNDHGQPGCGGACGSCYQLQTTGSNTYGPMGGEAPSGGSTLNMMVVDACYNAKAGNEWCNSNKAGSPDVHGCDVHFDIQTGADDLTSPKPTGSDGKQWGGAGDVVQYRPIPCPPQAAHAYSTSCKKC